MKGARGKALVGVAVLANGLVLTPLAHAQSVDPSPTQTTECPAAAETPDATASAGAEDGITTAECTSPTETTAGDPSPTASETPTPAPTESPSASPSPTASTSPDPTPTSIDSPDPLPTLPIPTPTLPDLTPTPTTSPSPSPSGSPSPSPSTTAPATSPTKPPTTPTPSPPAPDTEPKPAPSLRKTPVPPRNTASDELSEVSPQLQAAQEALAAAQARLTAAQNKVAEVHAAVDAARQADDQARLELEEARQAEQRAERALAEIREQLATIHDTVGAVARQAYQGGSYLQLSVALEASSPKEFTDRLVSVQSVLNAEGAAVGRLAERRADLANEQARLQAVREQKEQAQVETGKVLAERLATEQHTVAAQAELAAAVAEREAAIVQLNTAREVDRQRYEAFSALAGGLGDSIRSWAAELRRSGTTVDGTGDFVWPGTGIVTSRYGPRLHPILDYVRMHTGIDIARGDGYVYAADDGIVVFTGARGGYGNLTVVDHGRVGGRSTATTYGHQATFLVYPGEVVRKGQRIGVIGSTGLSTGPHIHFEVRLEGVPVDPYPWLSGAPRP